MVVDIDRYCPKWILGRSLSHLLNGDGSCLPAPYLSTIGKGSPGSLANVANPWYIMVWYIYGYKWSSLSLFVLFVNPSFLGLRYENIVDMCMLHYLIYRFVSWEIKQNITSCHVLKSTTAKCCYIMLHPWTMQDRSYINTHVSEYKQ